MWNNFLAEIVKYCSFVAMWNKIRLFTFAKQIFHSGAISLGEAKFHSPKANFTEKRYFPRFAIRIRTQTGLSEIFGVAECEIISLRKLWNISLCSMWNEICPHSRQRIFHICEANISQRSYFTCPHGQISLKKAHIVLVDKCVLFSGGA